MPIGPPEGTFKASAVHSANEALQDQPGRTTHQIVCPFAAIEDVILGSSETPTRTISTHNRTSDHVNHSYDSNSLADSNQPAAKNSEGMIHDKYNPPDNLQSTLKVSTLPPTDHPLKLQSAITYLPTIPTGKEGSSIFYQPYYAAKEPWY